MEKHAQRDRNEPREVQLHLSGIDKTWVRSPQGDWVDQESLKTYEVEEQVVSHMPDDQPMQKKWWKFW